MALSASTVWEIRTTGADTNGGGYVSGGTDWSQQDSPQYAVTDAVTAGTTTITSATANFGADVVGNICYVAGGTGSVTAGWYQIISRTNSTTIVVDRSTGLTAGTGVTLNIGGALATLAKYIAISVGTTVYIKGTGHVTAANLVLSYLGLSPQAQLIGYGTTRTDRVKAKITAQAGCTTVLSQATNGTWSIRDMEIDCADIANIGLDFRNDFGGPVRRCKVSRFAQYGIKAHLSDQCEVTAGKAGSTAGILCNNAAEFCYVHDNPCTGITTTGNCSIRHNICYNNTGASSDGIAITSYANEASIVSNNTCISNGRNGIFASIVYPFATQGRGNLLESNGAYGLNLVAGNDYASWDGNAYYGNATAARNPVYAGEGDVTLTASAVVSAAGGNFALNSTAGGGAACKAVCIPTSVPGASTSNYQDIGAVQSQASASGGNPQLVNGGFDGGFV